MSTSDSRTPTSTPVARKRDANPAVWPRSNAAKPHGSPVLVSALASCRAEALHEHCSYTTDQKEQGKGEDPLSIDPGNCELLSGMVLWRGGLSVRDD